MSDICSCCWTTATPCPPPT